MSNTLIATVLVFVIGLISLCGIVYLFVLVVKTLKKYINSSDIRKEKSDIKKSLGETLKEHRISCNMTQEFVAEVLGVSRQAVSKWENGISDPSTSNLIAIARLYNTSVEDLLKNVE